MLQALRSTSMCAYKLISNSFIFFLWASESLATYVTLHGLAGSSSYTLSFYRIRVQCYIWTKAVLEITVLLTWSVFFFVLCFVHSWSSCSAHPVVEPCIVFYLLWILILPSWSTRETKTNWHISILHYGFLLELGFTLSFQNKHIQLQYWDLIVANFIFIFLGGGGGYALKEWSAYCSFHVLIHAFYFLT